MFKITNVDNGREFIHHTKMGLIQDKTILERYGVPFVSEEIDATDDKTMDNFGFE